MGASQSGLAGLSIPTTVEVAPASGSSGSVRRNAVYSDELKASAYPGDVVTCYDAFQRGVRMSPAGPCFGFRPVTGTTTVTGRDGKSKEEPVVGDFVWITYTEVAKAVDEFASGLVHFELLKANDLGDRLVGIYSKNRWEWAATQQALYCQCAASVPLYDTLGADAVAFITQQSGLATIVCGAKEAKTLVAAKAGAQREQLASLLNVVQFEDVGEADRKAAADAGLTLRSFTELRDAGKANPKAHVKPTADNIAVICYTSGTTGNPKGAILTHRNMIADASGAKFNELGINCTDVHLSYLPLAHVFEQLVENALIMEGAAIGFYQGDTLKILDDVKALRPTVFPSVPRLFNRIFDKIASGAAAAGGLKTSLFNRALEAKKDWLKSNYVTHSLWDSLVFGAIAKRTGLDRVRLFVSGSAPLAPHVMEFLRCVFSTRMVEGYGQTECGGAASVTSVHDQATLGHVGIPLACNEIKLVDVEDMGYRHTDTVHGRETDKEGRVVAAGIPCAGRGEVCYRGPNVFPGYYKDAEKTREALDADGWLHSGDIGLWTDRGYLKIVDRKKNMFKLSQGEYVAAEKIENALLGGLVGQIFVYGDSFHSMLVAIVVPEADNAKTWAGANGLARDTPLETLCGNAAFKKAVLDQMTASGREKKLQGFEMVKDIHLAVEAWTPENILTPTFKLKRNDAKRLFQAQIDAMYERLDPVAGMKTIRQGAA